MNTKTKSNDSRKRLIRSMLVLLLCIAMLIGSTWAWFTDSASNTGNRIVAGTLKVDLLMDKTKTGTYASIKDQTGDIFSGDAEIAKDSNVTLWEPGKTQIVYLAVQNAGSLDLKYQIKLNVKDVDGYASMVQNSYSALEYAIIDGAKAENLDSATKWSDIVTAAGGQTGNVQIQSYTAAEKGQLQKGNTDYFALAVHMKEDAGNEFQNAMAEIDVAVIATQLSSESDTFDNTYDEKATYPAVPFVINETKSQSGNFAKFDTSSITVKTNGAVTIGGGSSDLAKSVVPDNTTLKDASGKTITTDKTDTQFTGSLDRTITTASESDGVTYNISYTYTEQDKTAVTVSEFSNVIENVLNVGTGMNIKKVTHSHGATTEIMTKANDKTTKTDGTYFYDDANGQLYIWSSKYSGFKVDFVTDYAVSIGNQGYATLEAAIEAAGENDTIALQKDLKFTTPMYISKAVALDLSGHTITPSENLTGDADKDALFVVKRGGKLTVNDSTGAGKISTGGLPSVYAAVKMIEKADSGSGSSNNACLVINSGTIVGTYYAITGNGSRNGTDITINGGTLTATADKDNLGIFHPQNGTLNINGGTITGYSSAIEMRAGTLNISGGQFNATAETFSCNPNGSGNTTVGAAIAIAQHTTKQNIAVNISGGTFTGNHAFNEADPEGNKPSNITASITGGTFNGEIAATDVTGFIAGGTFNRNPISYLKTGYRALKSSSEDLWTVSQISTEDYTVSGNTIQIANLAQFVKFAQDANSSNLPKNVKTAELTADIDLDGILWTPINIENFTFDGKNFVISNLYANETSSSSGKVAGLFGEFSCSTMQNLTVNGATVRSTHYAAVLGAHGLCAKFENCTVNNAVVISTVEKLSNGEYDNGDKAGAICGYLSGEHDAWVKNCTVSNCTVEGYRDIGSVVGIANGTSEVSGNTATNVTIVNNRKYNPENYTTDTQYNVDYVVGRKASDATINSNTVYNVTKKILLKAGNDDVATKEIVKDAIAHAGSGDTIVLPEVDQTIDLKNITFTNSGVIIQGNDQITIKVEKGSNDEPSISSVNGAIFDGVNFVFGNQNYNAIGSTGSTQTFKNCLFNGLVYNYGNSTFEKCTFTHEVDDVYQVQVYGGKATFTGCTFNGNSKNALLYTEGGNAEAEFTDCVFNMKGNSTEPDNVKSAVQINSSNGGTGVYTVTISNCTCSDLANESGVSGNYDYRGIYGFKHSPAIVNGTVKLNGELVYSYPTGE